MAEPLKQPSTDTGAIPWEATWEELVAWYKASPENKQKLRAALGYDQSGRRSPQADQFVERIMAAQDNGKIDREIVHEWMQAASAVSAAPTDTSQTVATTFVNPGATITDRIRTTFLNWFNQGKITEAEYNELSNHASDFAAKFRVEKGMVGNIQAYLEGADMQKIIKKILEPIPKQPTPAMEIKKWAMVALGNGLLDKDKHDKLVNYADDLATIYDPAVHGSIDNFMRSSVVRQVLLPILLAQPPKPKPRVKEAMSNRLTAFFNANPAMSLEVRAELVNEMDAYLFGVKDERGYTIVPGWWDKWKMANPEMVDRFRLEPHLEEQFQEELIKNVELPDNMVKQAYTNVSVNSKVPDDLKKYVAMWSKSGKKKIYRETSPGVYTEEEIPAMQREADLADAVQNAEYSLRLEGRLNPTMDQIWERAALIAYYNQDLAFQQALGVTPTEAAQPGFNKHVHAPAFLAGKPGMPKNMPAKEWYQPAGAMGNQGQQTAADQGVVPGGGRGGENWVPGIGGGGITPNKDSGFGADVIRQSNSDWFQNLARKNFPPDDAQKLMTWFDSIYDDYVQSVQKLGMTQSFGDFIHGLGGGKYLQNFIAKGASTAPVQQPNPLDINNPWKSTKESLMKLGPWSSYYSTFNDPAYTSDVNLAKSQSRDWLTNFLNFEFGNGKDVQDIVVKGFDALWNNYLGVLTPKNRIAFGDYAFGLGSDYFRKLQVPSIPGVPTKLSNSDDLAWKRQLARINQRVVP